MNVPSPRPDQEIRHRTRHLVVAGALLLGWAVVAVQSQLHEIDQLARANVFAAAEQLIWLARIVAVGLSLGILILGAWVWWMGRSVVRAGHFPPPEIRILRRTRVFTGSKAKVLGWMTQLAGVLVFLLGTITAWLFVECAEFLLRR